VVRYACPEISRALLLTDPSPPIHPGACLELVMHPGVEEQARIVMAMHLLAMQTDIENLQGTFLRLLLVGDVDAVKALIAHAVEYNRSLDAIREIVEGAKALGFHTGGVSETI
jgi:hypothetical protein